MKKLSKRLLAMLLVAVMVVAAIPFGAFADGPIPIHVVAKNMHGNVLGEGDTGVEANVELYQDKSVLACQEVGVEVGSLVYKSASFADNTLTVIFDDGNHNWTHVSSTNTEHTYGCSCGIANVVEAHTWGADGKCTRCGMTHDHKFDGGTVPNSGNANGHRVRCSVTGCTATTTVSHEGESYDEIAATAATCTTAGNKVGKRYACGYVEGKEVIAALGHKDADENGVCDVCNATGLPVSKKTYTVTVDYGTTTASGHSEEFTDSQITANFGSPSALRTYLSGLGGDYAAIASKMADTDYASDKLFVNSVAGTIYVNMKSAGSSSQLPNTGDTFNVTFTIDGGTSYTRTVNVGDWYFNAGMAGNANGWGNKQVSLRITNALGSKRLVDWNSKDSSAYVQRGDVSVEIFSKLKTVKIVFLKNEVCSVKDSNGTTVEYKWGSALGQLPELPYGYGYWCVDGKEITSSTTYNWELDKVYARPVKETADHNGNVHLFVYNSSNQLMKDFDVTDKVQETNGMLFLEDLVSIIKSRTGVSSVSSAGLMDESGWAYYLNNKNSTKYANSGLLMGTAAEREGVQNVYVVLKNVSGNSNADTSNPKTGDTAMIGTAAIVMALATVGMGTAFYMKKKELF